MLQPTVGGSDMLGLLLGVALDVGPWLGKGGDRVKGETGWALISRRISHFRVTATTLEAGSKVLAGGPVRVRSRSIVDVQ